MGETSRKSLRAAGPALIAAALLCAPGASAQTLYKLIDKNGKVTYSEEAPKNFDGKVIRMDIDPNANTATLPKPSAPPKEGKGSDAPRPTESAKPTRAEELAAAREKLESAKKALADARDNPKEGDVTWMGTKGGGTRAVPSEDFSKRIAELESRVREAEANVRRLE